MKVSACAKINLVLEILGRRNDGYHDLRSVVVPVSLNDELDIVEADDISSDSGYGRNDLCVKAAEALASEFHVSKGARISIKKRIPVGGGLGGGSADAAAVLVALNRLWGIGASRMKLAQIGAQVGSDVPALTLGGAVLMEGRGEKVSNLAMSSSPLDLVIANPGVECPTKEVYDTFASTAVRRKSSVAEMAEAIASGNVADIAASLANDLEGAALSLHPEIGDLLFDMRSTGAEGALMSGSGSSVFGIFSSAREARDAAESLRCKWRNAWYCQTC